MRELRRAATGVTGLAVVALALVGCENKETLRKLEELTIISAEKDSLLKEVVETTRLMNDISTELASVKDLGGPGDAVVVSPESPLQVSEAYRDGILEKIQEVTKRVNLSEERLRASQRRIRRLSSSSDSLKSELVKFEVTIADFRTLIEDQKTSITALTDDVNELHAANVQLAAEKEALADTVQTMAEKENTVFYVIGSKNDLLERGIVVEEGGKFLFFGKKTLQPARDLAEADFIAIDKREVTRIPFPRDDRKYRIASRHNLSYLGGMLENDGKIQGELEIDAPDEFWEPSKFLIIVES